MATWDITFAAGSGVGNSDNKTDDDITGVVPGDFDGATIDSVEVQSAPVISTDGVTDDTVGIRFSIRTSGGTTVYGSNASDAESLCFVTFGEDVTSDQTITDGSATSPAPTIAVAADWQRAWMSANYNANMKNDAETLSWSAFTVRVTYTPLPAPDYQQEHYRFATPITGAAHEAWTLVGTEDAYHVFDQGDDIAVILKIGNDGESTTGEIFRIEQRIDGGSYFDVDDSSTHVRGTASGDSQGATSSTERLTNTSRTFFGSEINETTMALTSDSDNDSDLELYYAVNLRTVDFNGFELAEIRAFVNGETVTYAITAQLYVSSAASWAQSHYQFATPITSFTHEFYTLVGSEDTSFEVTLDTGYALIVKLENDAGIPPTGVLRLQYNVDGGGWNDVNGSSSNVRSALSSDVDNATSTTERLTNDGNTFQNSRLDETDGAQATFAASAFSSNELYFALEFRSAELSGGESITFRLMHNELSEIITYDVTPTATIEAADGNHTRDPLLGTLTLSGQVPDLATTNQVPVGSAAFAGFAPTLQVAFTIAVPVGSMTITGLAPTVERSWVAEPGVGVGTFTGLIPTLDHEENHIRGPPLGALTLTGFIPNVNITVLTSPDVGTLSLTGFAPSVEITHVRLPATGTLALTGFAPSVEISHVAQPPVGSLVFAGAAPTVDQAEDHVIPVPVGSLTLAGQQPTAQATENHVAQPPLGTLALAGFVPSIERSWTVTPPAGTLTFAGFIPTLDEAAGDITRDPGVGTLSITGFAPTAVVTKIRTPDTGTLAFVGFAPSVEISHVSQPDTGSLAFTGFAPVAQSGDNHVRQPDAGALALTGFAPSVEISHVAAPDAGSLLIAGQQPTVLTTDNHVVPVPVGALTLAGQQPVGLVSDNHVIPVPVGSLALTGLAPSVEITHVREPATGTLTFAGQQPTVQTGDNHVRGPNIGTLALTGLVPTVERSWTAEPGAGSLSLTGFEPTVEITHVRQPATGTLTFAGQQPTAQSGDNHVRGPNTGALAITGFAPSVEISRVALPGVGSLSLAGFVPVAQAGDNHVRQPGVGSLTFAGQQPAALTGDTHVRQPGVGSLALTGFAPSVEITHVRQPGTGSLTLTGLVPSLQETALAMPGVGSLAFAGFAPSVEISHVAQPGTGSLTIAGQIPTAIVPIDVQIAVPLGSLSFTGLAPTIDQEFPPVQLRHHTIKFSGEDGESMAFSSSQGNMTFDGESVSIVFNATDLLVSAILLEGDGIILTEAGFRLLKEQL